MHAQLHCSLTRMGGGGSESLTTACEPIGGVEDAKNTVERLRHFPRPGRSEIASCLTFLLIG